MTAKQTNAEDTCLNNQTKPPLEGICDDPEKEGSLSSKEVVSSDLDIGLEAVEPPGQRSDDDGNTFDGADVDRVASNATTLNFPEGGSEGWLVVFGAFCAMISVFGLINSSAVFESYFSTHQLAHHSPSEIGWIFSVYLFIVFFVGIQVGPIFDHYGGRILVAAGSLLLCASLLILSWCETYYQIMLTYSVLGGLGGALLNPPAYGSIAHFFHERRGLATGIATTSGGVGGIVFPLLLRHLLPTLGFAWSCRILALILLGLAVPANLLIKTRLPRAPGGMASVWPDLTIFRDPRYALSSVGVVFMEWGLFTPTTFIVSYAAAHGTRSATDSYVLLAYLNAASVVGRVVPGFLADKFGRFNVIVITISFCAITVLALWLPAASSGSMLIAFVVLFGFASGSNLGLIPVCFGQLCDSRHYGRYFSTAMMVASFGTLSSVPIAGALLDIRGEGNQTGWMSLILFSGISYAIAMVCYAAARVLAVGWRPLVKF
ncbi:major facilitator superfamily domain-containing protein [Cercophora newfieldiana]|uniref:Major facilitator superfamily domain-containing protein n=1 Tax=Cercophora newfieldiana TaxID=92897 RepID=A0AA39YCT6_9PEZI|nr:major facilitator superfamily domain-containing protein [Cercophora newfieldiana]